MPKPPQVSRGQRQLLGHRSGCESDTHRRAESSTGKSGARELDRRGEGGIGAYVRRVFEALVMVCHWAMVGVARGDGGARISSLKGSDGGCEERCEGGTKGAQNPH